MKIYIAVIILLFNICANAQQIKYTDDEKFLLENCENKIINQEKINELRKNAVTSINPHEKNLAYLCFALYFDNEDSVLVNLEKSIICLVKYSEDSLLYYSDTLYDCLAKKIDQNKSYIYSKLGLYFYHTVPKYSIFFYRFIPKI